MGSHTSRHTGKNSGFATQDEHLVLLGLEALTDTPNFRSATRSKYAPPPLAYMVENVLGCIPVHEASDFGK